VTARGSARITSTDDDLGPVQRGGMAVEQQTVSTRFPLPEIRAWALRSSPATAREIDSVIGEWSRAARTRSELYWLEGALARQRRRAASRHLLAAASNEDDGVTLADDVR
jgi:hypothetical protein